VQSVRFMLSSRARDNIGDIARGDELRQHVPSDVFLVDQPRGRGRQGDVIVRSLCVNSRHCRISA